MTVISVAEIVLHRRDDPRNEYRELEVLRVGSHYQMWENTRFAGTRIPFRSAQTEIGSAHRIRKAIKQEIERLCTEEDFILVSRCGEKFLDG